MMRKKKQNGIIQTYTHHNKRVGSIVEILCESDFCANTNIMKEFAVMLSMQVAAMPAFDTKSLLDQNCITQQEKTIKEILDDLRKKLKEDIKVNKFVRWELD